VKRTENDLLDGAKHCACAKQTNAWRQIMEVKVAHESLASVSSECPLRLHTSTRAAVHGLEPCTCRLSLRFEIPTYQLLTVAGGDSARVHAPFNPTLM